MLWGPLLSVGMRWHSPYYWILLEHAGTTWNLYNPKRIVLDSPECALPPLPEMHSCTDVWLPPYNTFTSSGELWDVLACVGIFPTTGYYWNTLEPAGTIWNLCPQHLTCIAALMCSYPPFHTIACVGMRFSLLLDTIGTHWNHLEPIRP